MRSVDFAAMSKASEQPSWDAREAFHRATMAVYADLGALVAILKKEPDLRIALLVFDEHASSRAAPELDDPELVGDLKHAAGRLRASLATAHKVRATGGKSSHVGGHGGLFGGISTDSHHAALLSAAAEVLEPDAEGAARSGRTVPPQSASGVIRRQVVESVMDAKSWARLAKNLDHEYRSAGILPEGPIGRDPEFADAMARYGQSRDAMRTAHLNPSTDAPDDQARSSSTQPSSGRQPELEEGAPSVDWAAEHAQLVEEGDTEGARLLEKLLASPRRCERPMNGVTKGREGQPDRKVVIQPLTDEAILVSLRNRRWVRMQRAELRQVLDVDATTPVGIFTRWRGLAAWAPRFARHYGGREVIHFGVVDGNFGPVNVARMYPGAPGEEKAPELAWAEALRESTSTLVALALDAKVEDVPLQRLLQDLDDVLDGKAVELGRQIREVDVLVRAIAARIEHPRAANTNDGHAVPRAKEIASDQNSVDADRHDRMAQSDDTLKFKKAEMAVVLLMRDGLQPRSMRKYAREVDLSHSTLSRNEKWRAAWQVSKEAAKANVSKMPQGSKDKDGNMEAWTTEVCENCRDEPITVTATVSGELVRICEACACKLAQRPKPRTT